MAQQPSALLGLRNIGTAGALWVMVGVPVAAAIAALSLSLWVIASFPEMALTAALLGAVQGLWANSHLAPVVKGANLKLHRSMEC